MSMRVSYCVERHCDCLLPFPKEAAICPIPILPDGVTRQSQSNVSCGPMLYFSESFEMIGMAETKAGRVIEDPRAECVVTNDAESGFEGTHAEDECLFNYEMQKWLLFATCI